MNFIILFLSLVTGAFSFESDGVFVEVRTNGSVIVGQHLYTLFENKPYAAFWKVPYAEPPIGDLRFKAPEGLLDLLASASNYSTPYKDSCSTYVTEDCLYISLFVPLSQWGKTLPVMVWIHEYSKDHGPDFLIDEDVIIVTVSYRVGIFGFLNTDDAFAEGNMGAKDVVMALRWVRQNIAYLNGDPNTVTVFGSGSAASIVASLLVSPAAEDLYERVIVQSGTALSPADYRGYHFEVANKLYWQLGGSFDKFDRKRLYKMLSTADVDKLVSVSYNLFDSTEMRDNQRLINSFGPSVEMPNKHSFINKRPLEVYDRKMTNNNVDVMMGYNSLESIQKLSGLAKNRKLLPCLNYNFQYLLPFEGKSHGFGTKTYREIRRRIMDFYFVNGTITERSFRRYAKYVADQVVYPLLRQAKLHAEVSCSNVYLYRFPFNGAMNVAWHTALHNSTTIPGATSGDEICYLFRCKSVKELYSSPQTLPEKHFIKKITRLWANFAKFGNPTPLSSRRDPEDIEWQPMGRHDFRVLNLNKDLRIINAPEQKRFEFLDKLREEIHAEKKFHDEL